MRADGVEDENNFNADIVFRNLVFQFTYRMSLSAKKTLRYLFLLYKRCFLVVKKYSYMSYYTF